jgi:hypothetical protein
VPYTENEGRATASLNQGLGPKGTQGALQKYDGKMVFSTQSNKKGPKSLSGPFYSVKRQRFQ